MVSSSAKNKPENLKNIVRSSRQHHQEAGLPILNFKRHKATKKFDKRCEKLFAETFEMLQNRYEKALIDDDFKDLRAKFKAYSKPKLLAAKLLS